MNKIKEAYTVFTPSRPIISQELFCGRQNEIERLKDALFMGGRHALLYGDRGVGKTSLARQACRVAEMTFYTHQCSSSDTFEIIAEDFLSSIGIEYRLTEEVSEKGSVNVAPLGIGAKADIEKSFSKKLSYAPSNPSWVSKQLQNHECVLIIDEYDVISSSEEKTKISQLIKSLSDIDSKTKIIVVGIGTSAKDLLAGHESIVRCLEEVHLGRMNRDELSSILDNAEGRLDISIEDAVKEIITKSSNGFPYFTHLLGLKTVIEALNKDKETVDMDDYHDGLAMALQSMDRSLQDSYTFAVGDRNNLIKRQLLYSVATSEDTEITTDQIKALHYHEYKVPLETVTINNNLSKAMGNDSTAMLMRLRMGVYVFSNPLMPVYIRLLEKPPVSE